MNARIAKFPLVGIALLAICCASCTNLHDLPAPPVALASDAPGNQSVVTLQNDAVHLTVDPRIGRVIYFGRALGRDGGPNLLWMDPDAPATAAKETGGMASWMNWGGDKLWFGPQALWPTEIGRTWPPDEVFDGQPWTIISQDQNHVVIQSRESPSVGGRFRRAITLHADEPIVDFDNAFIRTQPNPMPIQLWAVTQVKIPERCLLDVLADAPAGVSPIVAMGPPLIPAAQVMHDQSAQWMEFAPSPQHETKVGTFGNWIASISSDVFVQISRYQPGDPYPERCSVQAYTNGKWVEIETVSPMVFPRVGQTVHHSVHWCLMSRSKDSRATVKAINRLVQQN